MDTSITRQLNLSNPQAQVDISLGTSSEKVIIEEKIEGMTKSLAQVSVINTSKSFQWLNKIQKQRQIYQREVEEKQKGMLNELNSIEKDIFFIERQRLLKQAGYKVGEQQIHRLLNQSQFYFRGIGQRNHELLSELGEGISNIKIQIVEKQAGNKQKLDRLQRETQYRVSALEKVLPNQKCGMDSLRQKMKKQFKALRTAIDQENRILEKQKSKIEDNLDCMKTTWLKKIQEEKNKQNQGFQHNYQALQEIFKLMQQESMMLID